MTVLPLLLATAAAIAPMPADSAKARTLDHIRRVDARLVERAGQPWSEIDAEAEAGAVLAAAVQSLYLASEPTRELIELTGRKRFDAAAMQPLLEKLDKSGPFVASNVRSWLGRQLATGGSVDEAALLLESVAVEEAIDPAAALFFRAVCEHAALEKEAGLQTIERLLNETERVPTRYRTVARLMRQDLEDLAENDMAEIAHDMKNVERRLQQGRSGEKTQEQEQRIIERLDQKIEKMQQQLQAMQGQGNPGDAPENPADESRIGGSTAPGEVDEREIGRRAGWGNLPDKERTEAKNLINRQFPSHYRQAVEEYLKRLAERPAK